VHVASVMFVCVLCCFVDGQTITSNCTNTRLAASCQLAMHGVGSSCMGQSTCIEQPRTGSPPCLNFFGCFQESERPRSHLSEQLVLRHTKQQHVGSNRQAIDLLYAPSMLVCDGRMYPGNTMHPDAWPRPAILPTPKHAIPGN
jgi:hypothetical protein